MSWANNEEKAAAEQEAALVVTPKSGENLPAPSKPTFNPIQNIKENPIPIISAAIAVSFLPVVGQVVLVPSILALGKVDKK